VAFEFDPRAGKGGHGQIIFSDQTTTLRSSRPKEIPPGTLRKMLSDLGIDPQDLG
jgi:predicted RNA binding protein YcfA (HicA-like mRNA interferase family)